MALPSGTVALLLTDVEASSQGWNRSPLQMEGAVTDLDADVHAIVTAQGGSVVKARGEGDSHFAAFPRASQATVAAAALQGRSDQRLSVRCCLTIGELEPRDDDYVGAVVNHGARVRSAAHGRQVVATRAVVDVAEGHLPDELGFRTLGIHRLRDIPGPLELFQLTGPGLPTSFPPLRTRSFATTALMAVVAVDEVRSTHRLRQAGDGQVISWQRELIRSFRKLVEAHDGRHLKILGDGCHVAFEDPRTALEFAACVHELGTFRIGAALGLVDVIEGELVGRALFEAHTVMRTGGAGDTRCCSAMQAVCPDLPQV
jgi:class 3 adenylate cyclase